MIYFDLTKTSAANHSSGLTRVGARLRQELGGAAVGVVWENGAFRREDGAPLEPGSGDTVLTAELFSEAERRGLTEFIDRRACRLAAVFHDAIPLKHPHITWPQSVARHPGYMKLLSRFDRVWAVSEASREELTGFWKWQGVETSPPVEVLPLGADFSPERPALGPSKVPPAEVNLLSVGIIEPRKNHRFLVDVCSALWAEGLKFNLHLAGRINPHFGRPIADAIAKAGKKFSGLHYHGPVGDDALAKLYAAARATVLPTIAEGCGLPLLESLWLGTPCICSALAPMAENAAGGGCILVPPGDRGAWKTALRRIVTDAALAERLRNEARTRKLPTWAEAAETIRRGL